MLRRKREAAEPEAQLAAAPGDGIDQLLDTIAALLRTWGGHPIELDSASDAEIREIFERWACHALVASLAPGAAEGSEGARDWPALQRFATDHRRTEQAYVKRSLGDLRDVIWTFIESLGKGITEDRRTDGRMVDQLEKLRSAARSNDSGALKQEALRSINLIETLVSARSARLRTQVDHLASRLDTMKVELVDVRAKLSRDPLTRIYNRAGIDDQMRRMVHLGTVAGSPATAFLIDVDHFKWVNDRHGHAVGDETLKRLAERLAEDFRRKGDFVGRFGGDEFLLLVPEGDPAIVARLCDRVVFGVRDLELGVDGSEKLRVSVSVGAAILAPGDDVPGWLETADRALYRAKERGRDRYSILPDPGDQGSTPG